MATLIVPRRTVMALVGLGLAAGVVGVALVLLPTATIVLRPAQTEKAAKRDIVLSTTAQEPDFMTYTLPARLIEATATEERTVERSGAQVSEDFARGTVTLVNKRDEVQELLPQTHLKHGATGVYFLTDSPVAIPAQGSVAMNVTAKEKGAAGNVGPGRFEIEKLPAELKADVYAESSTAFAGGVVVETPISEEELVAATQEVRVAAEQKARAQLTSQTGGAPLRESLVATDVMEEIVSAEVGSRAQAFTVKATVRARGFLAHDNDLLSLTLLALRSQVEADKEFESYRPESFAVTIERADFDAGQARVVGTLTGVFASKIGPSALEAANLAGLSAEEVREHFRSIPEVGEVEVSFSPFWVRSVPSRESAVQITIAK